MSTRMPKIDNLIMRELGTLIQHRILDPRLPALVSVSHVKASADLSQARIYLTALGDESELKRAVKILSGARRTLRRMLAKRIHLQYVPELIFMADSGLYEARRIDGLIDTVATHP